VHRIQSEQRASGELVHVELIPGVVTILPAWKLDAIYCAGLKVGAPQVSLAALCTLHELLIACETRASRYSDGPRDEETALGSNKETDGKRTGAHRVGPSLMQFAPAGVSTASNPAESISPRSGQMMCYENRIT
jgi:hypothetical protein